MMSDSPNSNLNPSFHPLSNMAFPHPLFTNTHQDLLSDHPYFVPETLLVGETGAPVSCAPPSSSIPAMRRQTKIHTSQGLRDRRVRLSIGIARQFFGLQDMLGFDKASKTLDWLLSKSDNAIRELAKSKLEESPASSDCHVATGETDGYSIGSSQKKKKKVMTRARKKICCGNPTAMNQSALIRASTSTSAQNNNNFPNFALDWEDSYNAVLPPSSFAVSDMNLRGTGLGAQIEHTLLEVPELPTKFP